MENNIIKPKRKNIFDSFQDGARKGFNIFVKNMLPSIVMAYTLIYILEATGLMDIVSNIAAPIMKIFGLPSEAIMVMGTAFFSKAGGAALAATFFTDGVLTAEHCTILLPSIFLFGGVINQWVRVIVVCGTNQRRQKYMIAMTIIFAFVSMWISKILFSFF